VLHRDNRTLRELFQSLTGRLKTTSPSSFFISDPKFQSLTGRLKTNHARCDRDSV